MSKRTEELRTKLETEVAFEASAEIGLDLVAALEAVEAKAAENAKRAEWSYGNDEEWKAYQRGKQHGLNLACLAIKEALEA